MRISLIIYVLFIFSAFQVIELKGQGNIDRHIDSLNVLLKKSDGKGKVDILNELSRAYWGKSYKESLELSSRAYDLAAQINYFEGMSDASNRIGNIYYFLKDTARALNYYRKSLELAQTIGSERRKGIVYNNIGLLYANFNMHNKAIHFHTLGLQAKIKNADAPLITSSLGNLGNSLYQLGEFEKSLEYYGQYIKIMQETGDSSNLAIGYELYGNALMKMKQFDKSADSHRKAYQIRESLNDSLGMGNSLFYIGQNLLRTNRLEGARTHFDNALENAKKYTSISLIRDIYAEISLLNEKEKKYAEAFQFHLAYFELNDSILKLSSDQLLHELKVIYETEFSDNQAEVLAMENEIQNSLLRREANLKRYLLIIILLVLVIAFIITSRFFLKQRLNKKLSEKIRVLEQTNQLLKDSEVNLQKMNITKDKFFGIIAHDLKNPFNALMGFSEMLAENLDDLTIEEMRNYVDIIHNSAKNLYRLLENLLLWSASQTGNISYAPESFDLRILAQKELALQKVPLQMKKIVAINKIPPGIIVYADTDLISKTFYNLLDNAMKYSHEGGSITLSAVALKNYAEISIADNGPGMSDEKIQHLFRLDNKPHETTEQRGTGLGLILCKYFIERNSGLIDVISTINKGTTFIFSIPLAPKPGK